MKIIKEGNINSYRHICPYCGCEYEYDDKDVQYTYIGLTTAAYSAHVLCPYCGKTNYIDQYKPLPNQPYPWNSPISMYCSDTHLNQQPDEYKSEYNCIWHKEDEE